MQVSSVALLPELVVEFRVDPPHGLHHLLAELHGWRKRLRVPAQDVPEVDVEQGPGLREE